MDANELAEIRGWLVWETRILASASEGPVREFQEPVTRTMLVKGLDALLTEVERLRAAIVSARKIVMERIEPYHGDGSCVASACMECGRYGMVDEPDTIKHHEECFVGRALVALKAAGM